MKKDGEKIAKGILESIGLEPKKISETSEHKTADYFSDNELGKYLVEVKTKDDENPLYSNLKKTGPIVQTRTIQPKNTIAALIDDGMEQIRASKQYEKNTFNLILFFSTGIDSSIQTHNFQYTFFGCRDLAFKNPTEGFKIIPCYGFTYSEAYNHPDLDAAILVSDTSSISYSLLVNPYGSKINEFRGCELYRYLKERNGIVDPLLEETENNAFIVSGKINLKNPAEVLEHIRCKYKNPNLEIWEWKHASYATFIPKNF